MPRILSFRLKNFKGAKDVTVDVAGRVDCPVVTLIGLNESGKTTILEGISHFLTGDKTVSSLFEGIHSSTELNSLVPIHRKAAFSEEITISALIALDDADYEEASKIAKKNNLKIERQNFPREMSIAKIYRFQDSVYKETDNIWNFEFKARPARGSKDVLYEGISGEDPDIWDAITDYIWDELPDVAYFPTFLVEMPARIYLAEHKDERPVNRFYREVFEDILDSIGEGLSLEKHVTHRIEEFRQKEGSPNWFSVFYGGPNRRPIDSVFQKISNAVTRKVLGSWQRVFQRPITAKNIAVEWRIDTEKNNLPYAVFFVSDGDSLYEISDRSLGFRWFFSFLLFTAFKQSSKQRTYFVFDEPAANLHAKAQAELLTSFANIVSGENRIIYSTHSHHMINPKWLSGAYIIENSALDYDADDSFGLTTRQTDIKATTYRRFVSQYPNRTSYFQPVIEKLEYVVPELIGSPPFVIVEGISDYYALKVAKELAKVTMPFSLIPSTGSGASGPLISLLMGRAENFIVLLDDDESGNVAAKRYREEWVLPKDVVLTLVDIDPKFSGMKLENLISDETKSMIAAENGHSNRPSKKEIGLYLAEIFANGPRVTDVSSGTLESLTEVLMSLMSRVERVC